jgi:uncharacterized protein (TIGR03437 family)
MSETHPGPLAETHRGDALSRCQTKKATSVIIGNEMAGILPKTTLAIILNCAFILAQPAPAISIFAVTNPADFQPGLPLAGNLASIFTTGLDNPSNSASTITPPPGSLPIELAGVGVTINGVAAPIAGIGYLPGYQVINVQVPWETTGQTTKIVVTQNGVSAEVNTPVVGSRLDYFSAFFADANGYGRFLHVPDFTPVTPASPAHPGEYLAAYALNLGPVSNQPADGMPTPDSPFSVPIFVLPVCRYTETLSVGNAAANVQFEGLAPGLVGVYQINFQVPLALSGGEVRVFLMRQLDEVLHGCSDPQSGHQFLTQISRGVVLPIR